VALADIEGKDTVPMPRGQEAGGSIWLFACSSYASFVALKISQQSGGSALMGRTNA